MKDFQRELFSRDVLSPIILGQRKGREREEGKWMEREKGREREEGKGREREGKGREREGRGKKERRWVRR